MKSLLLFFLLANITLVKQQYSNGSDLITQGSKQIFKNKLSIQQLKQQQQLFDQYKQNLSATFLTDTTYLLKNLFYYAWSIEQPFNTFKAKFYQQLNLFIKWIKYGLIGLLIVMVYSIGVFLMQKRRKSLIQRQMYQTNIKLKQRIIKISLLLLIVMSFINAKSIFFAIRQANFLQKSLNTLLCNFITLNLQPYITQIQTYYRQCQTSYSLIQPLILDKQYLRQMIEYGDNMTKVKDKGTISKNIISQDLKNQVRRLNQTYGIMNEFVQAFRFYNQTIQFLRQNLIIIKMIKTTLVKYLIKYISLETLSSRITIFTNFLYYLMIISFGYILTVIIANYKRNTPNVYKKWSLIPFMLSTITIYCLVTALLNSIVSANLYYFIKGYEDMSSSHQHARSIPNIDAIRKFTPQASIKKGMQFAYLFIAKDAQIQNINGKDYLYNKIKAFDYKLKDIQTKQSSYYHNLYKQAYQLILRQSTQPQSIKMYQGSQLQLYIKNELMDDIKQSFKGVEEIIGQRNLTRNIKIDLEAMNRQTYGTILSLFKVLLNSFQFHRKVLFEVGYLSLFGLICFTVIRGLIKKLAYTYCMKISEHEIHEQSHAFQNNDNQKSNIQLVSLNFNNQHTL